MTRAAEAPSRRRQLAAAGVGIAIALLLLAVALARRSALGAFRTFTGEAMATVWQVTLPDRAGSGAAAERCFARYRELDAELSEWREDSPLTAVNRAAGRAPVAVPRELLDLLERALELGRATDGAFDVTWAALWGLWDFRAPLPRVPAADEIEARRRLVDARRVVLDRAAGTLFLPERGMLLGLGGIAKGYALDACAGELEAAGFRDFLLVGGGQVVARGRRGERAWRVGVRDPRAGPEDFFARVELGDGSLSTSADNESFFVVDGVRYHHILDPRTGRPSTGLRSATVLHRDATVADALSTAIMVLGRERGFEVARALDAEALVVDDRAEVAATPGLEPRLERLRAPIGADGR